MFSAKIENNKIVILTDDPNTHLLLEGEMDETGYNFFTKRFEKKRVRKPIYNRGKHELKNGTYKYVLGLGWTAYIMNMFATKLSPSDYKALGNAIVADTYRTAPFKELRDYQNQDILFLLKYKIGLFQCNTGYGK